jgi:hypothetical protein
VQDTRFHSGIAEDTSLMGYYGIPNGKQLPGVAKERITVIFNVRKPQI